MADRSHTRIAILATHGFEFSELAQPRTDLTARGFEVVVVSPEAGEIRGWSGDDWGGSIPVDRSLESADAADFDALVLPGGQINPDLLRVNEAAVALIRDFHDAGKPIAAICHAPWLLIEAGIVTGRRATSYASIRTDMLNAGADWTDEPVVIDGRLITSRHPGDLSAFSAAIADVAAKAEEARRAA